MAVLDFPGKSVPLDNDQLAKLRKFLYPATVLLVSLNEICPRGPPQKPSDAPWNPNQSPEEMFHTFVKKLALICDFEPKGGTITAISVIWYNARICYLLASNHRGTGALRNARAGLQAVLDILKSNLEAKSKDSDEVMKLRLMREILLRNMVRVRTYLTSLAKDLQARMKRCDAGTPEGRVAREALEKLAHILPDPKDGQKSEKYIDATILCIKTIQDNRKLPLQRYIDARAVEDNNMAKGGSWSSLQHTAGRLLAYHTFYPATALPNSKSEAETAEAIINRAPGYGQARIQTFKKHAAELQQYDLDTQLKDKWKQKMEPVIHAEVLLHTWLSSTEGGVQPYRFFQGWRYIGTSKPICRLCEDYFNMIATPVQFRPGHRNTYLNWRLPDMYVIKNDAASIKDAKEAWCKELGEMKRRVYAAVVRVLEEKVSDKKLHDSNTYTDRITGIGDMNQITNWLGNLRTK